MEDPSRTLRGHRIHGKHITAIQDANQDIQHLVDIPGWFEDAFKVPRFEHVVDANGIDVHYFRWGDPSLPGVVMIHGSMSHARCWAFIAPLLAKNFCVVALDLSGMGESGWRATYPAVMRAEEPLAVADHAGLLRTDHKPTLVCHSYGSAVGLVTAEQHQDLWGGLMLCDMCLLAPSEPSQLAPSSNHRAGQGIRAHRVYPTFEAARERFQLIPDQYCANQYLMDYMAFHSLKEVEGGWQWKFDPAILDSYEGHDPNWWHEVTSSFVGLDLPRAVIHGQHSGMMSDVAVTYLKAVTAGAVPIVEIPNAGHHLMLDQPIALAATLDALLQGC